MADYTYELRQFQKHLEQEPFGGDPIGASGYKYVCVEDTYLRLAAANEDEALREAMKRGEITVDYKDPCPYRYSDGLLHAATWGRAFAVIQLLFERSTNPNYRNEKGYSPWHVAVVLDDPALLCKLTEWSNLDKNQKTYDGRGPLHLAIDHRAHDSLRFLVSAGVDTKQTNKDGQTPLQYAQARRLLPFKLRELLA